MPLLLPMAKPAPTCPQPAAAACARLGRRPLRALLGAVLLLGLAACQPQQDRAVTASRPPVGHYEGSIAPAGQPAVRASLDIRYPSAGHYQAELTVGAAPALSFVTDSLTFVSNQLRLTRPARPGQTLTLTLDGDFWRGTLAWDSLRAETLLVKRGAPTPSAYRTEAVRQAGGPAWLFAPTDTGTLGPALALLPDSATAPAAALWADALARRGVIVLLLPAAPAANPDQAAQLRPAMRQLRGTAGADTANVGVWAAGPRADTLAAVLARGGLEGVRFFISQNPRLPNGSRGLYQTLQQQKLPLLGLFGGKAAGTRAAVGRLRAALGQRRGTSIRTYRTAGLDLLVPGPLGTGLAAGLPDEVAEWLRKR